jgi:hypothetical protein
MSFQKFLKTAETMKTGTRIERLLVSFLTGSCKGAGFLLRATTRVTRNNRAQVAMEYFIILCVITLFAMVLGSSSFFGRFRNEMNESMRQAVEAMDQPGIGDGTGSISSPGLNIVIPWWEETEEDEGWGGELPWYIMLW